MGKLVLLSNFGDGYLDSIRNTVSKDKIVFSYIPSRTEFGEIYFSRVKKTYEKIGVDKFHYIDIDNNYEKANDEIVLNSDIVFLAGGDDPYIIKNFMKRKYDVLLKKFYSNGGTIIGLCAGASILSQYSIVSDYEGTKFDKIQVIPWGLNINRYMYYSRFDETCSLDNIVEFSSIYNQKIILASLDSVILIYDEMITARGKVLLVDCGKVMSL